MVGPLLLKRRLSILVGAVIVEEDDQIMAIMKSGRLDGVAPLWAFTKSGSMVMEVA